MNTSFLLVFQTLVDLDETVDAICQSIQIV